MLRKKLLLKTASGVLTVSALIFGLRHVGNLLDEARGFEYTISPGYLLVSLAMFVGFYWVLAFHWLYVCNLFKNTNSNQNLAFYASQPYKYLPTSLFTFSFRAKYSKQLGMSIKKSSIAQLIENANLLGVGAYTALVFYILSVSVQVGILFMACTVILLLISPNKLDIKIKSIRLTINKGTEVKAAAMVFIAWIASGLSFYMLNKGLGVSLGIAEAVSANSAAYSLGILAFFAPGGIGVREWAFSVFSVASISIIFWRILTFVIDMMVGAVAMVAIAYKTKKAS